MAQRMDPFTRAYFDAALWSSTDESRDDGGDPLDDNYSISDIADDTRDKMIADCADFQARFGDLIDGEGASHPSESPDELAGRDFWMTRNGHGVGFWDGGWPKNGDALTDASKEYGEFYLYVGDDGEIHGPPTGAHSVRERRVARRVRAPRASRIVADFSTLPALMKHASAEGALYVVNAGPHTKIYYPRGDGQFAEASVWQEGGYWHSEGPNARKVVRRAPPQAEPIRSQTQRWASASRPTQEKRNGVVGLTRKSPRPSKVHDYIAVDRNNRKLGGPFTNYGEAKDAAGSAGVVKFTPKKGPRTSEASRKKPNVDARAVEFFRKHAAGAVGREEETARGLAHAEQESTARGWRVQWEEDPEGWDSLGDIDPTGVRELLVAILYDENGEVLGSLGSIVNPDRSYARVIEAELASEALSEVTPRASETRTPARSAHHRIAQSHSKRRRARPQ